MSAAIQNITDFYNIEGVILNQNFDRTAAKKLIKNTEREVQKKMYGAQSGLTASTITELTRWNDLFDDEIHGARLSLTWTQEWIQGKASLPVLPLFKEQSFAMFVNRFCEIGWMLHRLLPLQQPPTAPLPSNWQQKWQTLDESFEIIVFSLTEQYEKKIGAAIVELVKNKFPFNQSSAFPL